MSVKVANEHLDVGISVSDEDLQALKETSENFGRNHQMKDIVRYERRNTL